MNLVTPDFGLLFWMVLSFAILLFILKKFAWKPVLKMIKEREESIAKQLDSAKAAKEQMEQLTAENEKIMRQARAEREEMLRDAKATKDKIVAEAQDAAKMRLIRLLPQHVWKFKPKKTRLWQNFLKRWDNFRLKLPKKFSAANSATKPSKATL